MPKRCRNQRFLAGLLCGVLLLTPLGGAVDALASLLLPDDPTARTTDDEEAAAEWVKCKLSAEPEAMHAFEPRKHKVRDLFLRYLSSLKVADTRGESGKTKIREDLLARAQDELGRDRVKDIFFGEFVVQ